MFRPRRVCREKIRDEDILWVVYAVFPVQGHYNDTSPSPRGRRHLEIYAQSLERFASGLHIRLVEARGLQPFRTLQTSCKEDYQRSISAAVLAARTGICYDARD